VKLPVTRFTQTHKEDAEGAQGGQPIALYLAVLPADQIIARAKVDVRKPGTTDGYQRAAVPSRRRQIARYVKLGGGLMPTAVLVNIRHGAEFVPGSEGSQFGHLEIPDGEPFWVEDGQHRLGGLQDASESPGNFNAAQYEVPVVFTTVPYDEEVRIFYVVNHEAKSVPTDLTAELIAEQVGKKIAFGEKPTAQEKRKAVAVYVAKRLAQEPGPWYRKIRLANEDKSVIKERPVGTSTFGSTLRPALMDAWMRRMYEGTEPDSAAWRDIYEVIRNYWLAIKALMPDASNDPEHYALMKPLGAYVFNEIMPDFLELAVRAGDFSPKFFQAELERLAEWVADAQWNITENGQEPMVRANNRQVIEYIVKQMRLLLRDNPSQQVAAVVLPEGSAPQPGTDVG